MGFIARTDNCRARPSLFAATGCHRHHPCALFLAPALPIMSQAAPLALTDAAHTEQKGWRRGQHLVDSLPYVDSLTPAEKAAVDKLIEAEVRSRESRYRSRSSSALALPPPPAPPPPLASPPPAPASFPPLLSSFADAQQQQEAW